VRTAKGIRSGICKINITPLSNSTCIIDRGQPAATIESIAADGGDRVANGGGCQTTATLESFSGNGGDGIRYRDGGEASAIVEGILLYCCGAIDNRIGY
jgi:hypothetical protein